MNKSILAMVFICVFIGIVTSDTKFEFPGEACVGGFLTGNFLGCASALATSIWNIHQWGADTPITVCGNQCTGNLKGRISSWKWVWDAKFQCSNKAQGIVGTATKLSRDGAMQEAIKNWLEKASKAGVIDINDFKC